MIWTTTVRDDRSIKVAHDSHPFNKTSLDCIAKECMGFASRGRAQAQQRAMHALERLVDKRLGQSEVHLLVDAGCIKRTITLDLPYYLRQHMITHSIRPGEYPEP